MKVCIAEKPSVAREIAQILGANTRRDGYMEGNGYQVTWTFGHLCTLKEPHDYYPEWKSWSLPMLPIIPPKFSIKLITNDGVEKQFKTIERLVNEADEVINCGDAGQEGELIQRWVLHLAGCKKPLKRLWISSLTEEAIREGFEKLRPGSDFDRLYAAGSARAIGDWLLGMNATRLYSLKYGKGRTVLSVGRVQTPTLALVVQRQLEIENFKPEPYWELKTVYREVTFALKSGRFEDVESARAQLEAIRESLFRITHTETKKGKESPPRLFDLTSLQVECNRKFSFSAEDTLKIIQSLYEKKLTTYPRVDTTYLSTDIYAKVPEILRGLTPYQQLVAPLLQGKIKKSTQVFDDKKITDHHAIIPTGKFHQNFTPDEKRVYDLVTRRFIAAFYPDCTVSNTVVEGEANQVVFRATGKQILEPGWRVIFPNEKSANPDENIMPEFTVGEEGPHEPDLAEKQTQPPKYHTEATLLRAMETAGKTVDDDELREVMKENGIGRPSTRANIIETLFKRRYIVRDKKRILATQTGVELIAAIENELLKSAELTGIWEKKMRDIERGVYNMSDLMDEMRQMVIEVVHQVKYSEAREITIVEALDEKLNKADGAKKERKKREPKAPEPPAELICPSCKNGHIVKGKTAWGCNAFQAGCRFRVPFEFAGKKITDKQMEQLILKGSTSALKGFTMPDGTSRDGKLKLTGQFQLEIE
jgi:DNA topoisomerase III